MIQSPANITRFWLEECAPEDWYATRAALDAEIGDRFGATWRAARDGDLSSWASNPQGCLALAILTDQFPRNMFRGAPDAFATDALARDVAKRAIERDWDLRVEGEARQFFYMPLTHSECLTDQDRAVRLILTRMDAPKTLLHARAHREVIRKFGRFPFRNEALGRANSAAESAFLERGGYGAIVRDLQAA